MMAKSIRLSYVVLHPGMDVYDAADVWLGTISALRQPDASGRYREEANFYRFVPVESGGLAEPGFLVVSRGLLHHRTVTIPLRAVARIEPGRVVLTVANDALRTVRA